MRTFGRAESGGTFSGASWGGGGMSQVDIVRDRKGLGGPSNKLKA